MDIDATQVISFDCEIEEESLDDSSHDQHKVVGHLIVHEQKGLQSKQYPVYEGDNVIGRHETCNICIPSTAISKEHACIVISSGTHLLYDKGSRNKSKRGKLFLTPEVRYELKHNDKLTFGDVMCTYTIGVKAPVLHDSGSETEEEKADIDEDCHSDASSDILQPTQPCEDGGVGNRGTAASDHPKQLGDGTVTVMETPEHLTKSSRDQNGGTLVLPESESETDDELPAATLVFDDDDDNEDRTGSASLLTAATQPMDAAGGVQVTGATQVFSSSEDEESDADVDLNAATQAIGLGEEKTLDLEDTPSKKKSTPKRRACGKNPEPRPGRQDICELEATQAYDMEADIDDNEVQASSAPKKGKSGDTDENRNKPIKTSVKGDTGTSDTKFKQDKETGETKDDDDDDDDENFTGLFDTSTLACDMSDEEMELGDESKQDTPVGVSVDDATQVMDDGDASNSGAGEVNFDDATQAIDDGHKKAAAASDTHADDPTQVISDSVRGGVVKKVNRDDATQAIDNSGPTVCVGEEVKFDDGTVPIDDNPPPKDATVKLNVDDETLAVDDNLPTKGRAKEVGVEDETLAIEDNLPLNVDDETQPIDDNPTLECQQDMKDKGSKGAVRGVTTTECVAGTDTVPLSPSGEVSTLPVSSSADGEISPRDKSKSARIVDTPGHSTVTGSMTLPASEEDSSLPLLPQVFKGDDVDEHLEDTDEMVPESQVEAPSTAIITIPEKSPLKPALVNRDGQKRSPSPSPKRVAFADVPADSDTSGPPVSEDTGEKKVTCSQDNASEPPERQSRTSRRNTRRNLMKDVTEEAGESLQSQKSSTRTPAGGRRGKKQDTAPPDSSAGEIEDSRLIPVDASAKAPARVTKTELVSENKDSAAAEEEPEGSADVETKESVSETVSRRSSRTRKAKQDDSSELAASGKGKQSTRTPATAGEMGESSVVLSTTTRGKRGNSKLKKENVQSVKVPAEEPMAVENLSGGDVPAPTISKPEETDSNSPSQPLAQKRSGRGSRSQGSAAVTAATRPAELEEKDTSKAATVIDRSVTSRKKRSASLPDSSKAAKKMKSSSDNVESVAAITEDVPVEVGSSESVTAGSISDKTQQKRTRSGKKTEGQCSEIADEGRATRRGTRKSETAILKGNRQQVEEMKPDSGKKTRTRVSVSGDHSEDISLESPATRKGALGTDTTRSTGRSSRQPVEELKPQNEKNSRTRRSLNMSSAPETDGLSSEQPHTAAKSADTGNGRKSKRKLNIESGSSEPGEGVSGTSVTEEISGTTPVAKKQKLETPETPTMTRRGRIQQNKKPGDEEATTQTGTRKGKPARNQAGTEKNVGSSPSLRRTTLSSKPKVLFTGVIDEQGQKIVKDLGGDIARSIQDCTHLITDKIRRTVKFLGGLARGVMIVTPQWLDSCKSAGMFVDAGVFMVQDSQMEKQYKFSLVSSVHKANQAPMLQGYKIHVTKSVRPEPPQMKEILQCAGAEYLSAMPKIAGERTFVISCEEDKAKCSPALTAGIPVMTAEIILTGILRQELDMENFRLCEIPPSGPSGQTTTTRRRR